MIDMTLWFLLQETREKLKNILVMEWLQKNVKVNILPYEGSSAAAAAVAGVEQ